MNRIARLRERVMVQTLQPVEDDSGGQIALWQDAGSIWANVNEDSSREQRAAGIVADVGQVTVEVRAIPWLTVDRHRLVWRGTVLNIRGIITTGLQRRFMRLTCEKGLPA